MIRALADVTNTQEGTAHMEIFIFVLALAALVMTVFSLVHEYRAEEAELQDLEDRVLELRRQADALCGGYRPSSR